MTELTKKEVDRIIAEGSDEEFAELDKRVLNGESVLWAKQMPDYRSRIDRNIGRREEQDRIVGLIVLDASIPIEIVNYLVTKIRKENAGHTIQNT